MTIAMCTELGPIECTWVMEIKDSGPFLVDINAQAQNFFEKLKRETQGRLFSIYQRFLIPKEFRFTGDFANKDFMVARLSFYSKTNISKSHKEI